MLNPRAYDGAVIEIISGTGNVALLQTTIRGGQPIAIRIQFINNTMYFLWGLFNSNFFIRNHISIMDFQIFILTSNLH